MRSVALFTMIWVAVAGISVTATTIHVPGDYATIQGAIDASSNGDIVLVADGTYIENIDFAGKAIIVTSENGPIAATIAIQTSYDPVVTFNSGEGSNSILSGFTVEGDSTDWGILIEGTSPVIYGNIIRKFEVGIRADGGSPMIRKNEITLCSHDWTGPRNGGGIRMVGVSGALIDSNMIHHNYSDVAGGIFLNNCSYITVNRNLIYSDSSVYIGGLEIVNSTDINVFHNTLVGNWSTSPNLGAINISNSTDVTVVNNISAFNNEYGIRKNAGNVNLVAHHNDVYGNLPDDYYGMGPGTGSISQDPLFFNMANHLYYLTLGSPCIDAGDPSMPFDPDATIADMGALYFDENIFEYGNLAGTVTDIDGDPVENVHITIVYTSIETWTDAFGEYLIEGLPTLIEYSVVFSHPDYAEALFTGVVIYPDETTILDVVLEYYGVITGTVVDNTLAPIEDVHVEVLGTSGLDSTDVNGEFTISYLASGTYDVLFTHNQYLDSLFSGVNVVAGETTIVNMEMIEWFGCEYVVGDVTGNNVFNILDPAYGAVFFSNGMSAPPYYCDCGGHEWHVACDVDGSCNFNVSDIIGMTNYFKFWDDNIEPCPDCPPPGWSPYPIPPPGFHTVSDDDNLILTDEGVEIWFGNPDSSPIGILPGQPVVIDVYMETASDIFVGCFNLPLAADDQYITAFSSETDGGYYGDLNQWQLVQFLPPEDSPPNENGWSSQSLLGIKNIGPPFNLPSLHFDTPTRIATFVLETVNDPELIGQTVECLGPGINSRNGPAVFGDSAAIECQLTQHFSSLIFLDPGNSMGSLAGTVSDNSSLLIEGVTVSIEETEWSDITNADGEYYLDGILQGIYDIAFSHPAYCDTIRTSILVLANETTTLDVVLSDAGNIAGAVTDSESNTLEGIEVSVLETGYSDLTDSNGDYQITGLCPGLYDVSFVHPAFATITVTDVSIVEGETTIIDVVMWPAALDEVVFWYGNPNGQPIIAPIGDTLEIDVYAQTLESVYVNGLFLPLGSHDQYIPQRITAGNGQIYYPLTEWDEAWFTDVHGSPPNPEGWSNETLMGVADFVGPPNPFLHSETPLKIATFVVVTEDDPSLEGQTIDCLGPGIDPNNGGPGGFAIDPDGQWISMTEIYCPVFFTSTYTGSIAGVVSDTDTNPIEGVTATAIGTGISDITDALGEYLLDELNPGTYNISFFHPDYSTSYVNGVEVAIGLTTTVNVTLYPAGTCEYIIGDYNGNGLFNVADIIAAFSKLKIGSPEPALTCECPPGGDEWAVAMDVNNSCGFNVADAIAGFSKLKTGSPDLIPCELCPPTGGAPAPGEDDQPTVLPRLKSKVKGDIYGRSD